MVAVMDRLGDHELVRKWAKKHNRWGPDNQWSVWFGGGVVDALVETLDVHFYTPPQISRRYQPQPAVLGAVPWMTHEQVIDRLSHYRSCVVMAKPRPGKTLKDEIVAYARNGEPFPKEALYQLDDWGPISGDGGPPLITPGAPFPVESNPLGPVRVVGYRGDMTPILHTKLLLLGVIYWLEDDELTWTERLMFRPDRVWWGSANFTTFSGSHLEMGTLSDDPALLEHALDYLIDLIRLSEPFDSVSYWPTPDLAAGTWDDDAFAELAAEVYGDDEDE